MDIGFSVTSGENVVWCQGFSVHRRKSHPAPVVESVLVGYRPGEIIRDVKSRLGAGGLVDLKLEHYTEGDTAIVVVEGEIDVYTAPRLRELLIDLVNKGNFHLVVNMEKVEFLDSTGLG